jgi:hypothetical protein
MNAPCRVTHNADLHYIDHLVDGLECVPNMNSAGSRILILAAAVGFRYFATNYCILATLLERALRFRKRVSVKHLNGLWSW